MKFYGCFYIISESRSSEEETLFLQGFVAIANRDAKTLHHCINVGMDISCTNYGISPLEFAAAVSSPLIVTLLLDKACTFSSSIASPLHFATAFGRADIVELMVSRNQDMYVSHVAEFDTCTLLHE